MRDDPIIVGIVATIGTLALIALAVIAFLIIAPHREAAPFPAQNVDCAVSLVPVGDGSFMCPPYMP